MDILLIIKVMILVLIKWSCYSSNLCSLLSLKWLSYFEHIIQSLSNTCFFLAPVLGATPNHIPLKNSCPMNTPTLHGGWIGLVVETHKVTHYLGRLSVFVI